MKATPFAFPRLPKALPAGSLWLAALLYLAGVWMMLDDRWRPLPELPASLSPAAFATAWAAGQVIVLIRHEERCDRSSNACLGPADGITQAGSSEAARLGVAFSELGLAFSDLYHSPATRTTQSAASMFGGRSLARDWAAQCREGGLQVFGQNKARQRNLVVVTHSECIDGILDALRQDDDNIGYGSALFLRVAADGSIAPLALIGAQAWIAQAAVAR
ncbi:histidine phosphatase family protein [Pseudomonas sp. NPDC007930]|uniref:lipopolysaccharide core heptose(II)-phosphate phosphatase PmrG n=1 Tax=Pseudomonas sp. NPDC007930 TaxID=3364417 RepID=UPI0036EE2399